MFGISEGEFLSIALARAKKNGWWCSLCSTKIEKIKT